MSSASEAEQASQASASEAGQARRYSRDELLALKEHHDCQKLPAGLEPDDLSDLMESVFFDKNTMFDHSSSGDIYLGPQRGPPPGLRPAFSGPRRTGFAPGPLHSRLVDDGRSLSPDRGGGFNRMPSSNLTSAFATSPHKAPLAGVRPRFDDASRMERWDSNKQPGGGGADEDWTPRGRAARAGDWRAGVGEPGTPGTAAPLGAARHSLDRVGSGWGGRDGGGTVGTGEGAAVRRMGSGLTKESSGRWAKDDHDDWRARKQTGALPEPRYDWADRSAAAAVGPSREPPPGFSGPPARRGMPEWADDGADAHRGPVTAADIEAERQRMQKQWKAQRGGRGGVQEEGGGEHQPPHRGGREDEGGPNTFLGEVMADDDFDTWARDEMQHQRDEEKVEEERHRRAAAAPKPGQQIDVKALFGGGTAAAAAAATAPTPAAPTPAAAPIPSELQKAPEAAGEPGVRSRFANFFKLDEGAPAAPAAKSASPAPDPGAGVPAPQPVQPQSQPPQQQLLPPLAGEAGPPGASDANAGSMLLAMLKKQLAGGAVPGAVPLAQAQLQRPASGPGVDSGAPDMDDVAQVAMSAALQGLDEALVEEGLSKQQQAAAAAQQAAAAAQQAAAASQQAASPQPQPQVRTPPPHLQAQQAQQHAAMLAALGIRPLPSQQVQQQGLPPQHAGMPSAAGDGMLRGPGLPGLPGMAMPGGLPQVSSPAGTVPVGFPPASLQYQHLQAMQQQYSGMPQAPRPQYAQLPPMQQQPPQYGGLPSYQQPMAQQYRPPMGAPGSAQHSALLQQQAQQNALLAQLLAAQQRQQQQAAAAAQAQHLAQQGGAQQGQINLAALLAAAQGGGGGAGVGMSSQGINAAQLMGPPRVPGMMQPNMGQMQQPSAQLQLLQQLQMAAAHGQAGGGMPGGAGMGHPMQPGGLTAQQQQQLLGMLRAQQRQ